MAPLLAILWLAILVGAGYLVLIRPQRRQIAAHEALVKSIEIGDDVVLTSGILGTVVAEDDDNDLFTVEIAPGVHITVVRGAVGRRAVVAESDPDVDEIDVRDTPESND